MLSRSRTVHTKPPQDRVCCACGARRMPGDSSHRSRCRSCYAAYMRGYRAAKRNDRLHEFSAQLRQHRSHADSIAAIAQMVKAFGGPAGFATAFKACFDACPLGSHRAVTMLEAFLRLTETHQPPPLDQWTDADLAAALDRATCPQ